MREVWLASLIFARRSEPTQVIIHAEESEWSLQYSTIARFKSSPGMSLRACTRMVFTAEMFFESVRASVDATRRWRGHGARVVVRATVSDALLLNCGMKNVDTNLHYTAPRERWGKTENSLLAPHLLGNGLDVVF
jgi:hypothetical protein